MIGLFWITIVMYLLLIGLVVYLLVGLGVILLNIIINIPLLYLIGHRAYVEIVREKQSRLYLIAGVIGLLVMAVQYEPEKFVYMWWITYYVFVVFILVSVYRLFFIAKGWDPAKRLFSRLRGKRR